MKITYLIRNDEVKERFLAEELPAGVTRGAVGTYEAEGGKLFLLSFSVDGSTVAGARKLAKLRRTLCDDVSTRLLVDDASQKFAVMLYPRFAEYERKLRCAITLATCAEHDNFDDHLVKSLEELTLEALEKQLFYDRSFQDKVKRLTKDPFTRDEITALVDRSEEATVWLNLFGDEALSSVHEGYEPLREMRNKVMHQRLITEKDYDLARKMLRASIDELDAYIDKVRSDVSYPKKHAARAVSAAKLVRDNYESMMQNIGGSLEQFATIASASQRLVDSIDTSSIATLASRLAAAQEIMSSNRERWESVTKAISDSIGAMQTPAITSALANIQQPTALQKMIADGTLASFTSPFASVDTTILSQAALSDVDTSALSSLRQIASTTINDRDSDSEDVADEDDETESD